MAQIKLLSDKERELLRQSNALMQLNAPMNTFAKMSEIARKVNSLNLRAIFPTPPIDLKEVNEFSKKIKSLNLQPINYTLSSYLEDVNVNVQQFTEVTRTINKNLFTLFESKEYRDLIRETLEKHEIEYNKWKEKKAVEYEGTFAAMKEYYVEENKKILLPTGFGEFFEFWTDPLPFRTYETEYSISRNDFIKFHYFIKEKMDKDNLLIKTNFELNKKTTITEKLNYWLEIKDNFKDFYPQNTSLQIPDIIYAEHFEEENKKPEYVYWLLKYEAQDYFEKILLTQNEIVLANTKEEFEYQLNKIVEREKLVEKNRETKNYDYTRILYSLNAVEKYDVEYLRIKNGYHTNFDKLKYSIYDGQVNQTIITVYATHILLKNYLETKLKELEQPAAHQSPNIEAVEEKAIYSAKFDKLEKDLKDYDFFEIDTIKNLSNESKKKIITFLSTNDIPYQVAMMDYLGFNNYLLKQFLNTRKELYEILSEIFNTTDRTVKGNILVLNEKSNENKVRYTSHIYKEKVKNDYEKLK